MQRIPADFNNLGCEEDNVLVLGTEESANLRGRTLCFGDRVIIYEEGSLEAEGVLHGYRREEDGKFFWYAEIDPKTLKDIS